jgi:hypothetical protein
MALITFTMWTIASVGIAAEMLFMLLPWSFGWIQGTDATGHAHPLLVHRHPIVYFGSYQRTFPGTRWFRNRAEADSSATPWRAPRSFSS